ncbi:hypothetical protein [Absidia glauca]|uniref:Uncharacterized protein n=1 Tax=Absidia glauca TaxID=4829 RepID=A0A163LVM6_ABSGL|nr:hypothetical protein [Absidia glauca]
MDDGIFEEITKLSDAKFLLEMQLQNQRMERLNERQGKRKSARTVDAMKRRKTSTTYKRQGKRTSARTMDAMKRRKTSTTYKLPSCCSLSKNAILDMSNFSKTSQMGLLGVSKSSSLVTKTLVDGSKTVANVDLKELIDPSKIRCTKSAKVALNSLLMQPPPQSPRYLAMRNVLAQIGDTLSTRNDEMGMKLRLDLRIIAACNTFTMEVTTGEFARTTTTNESKLFKDKLKSVLATKVHLNHILATMSYMPAQTIKSIKVPIIQIMGLNCYVYSLAIIDKGVYCLRDEGHFVYPGTLRQMKNGCMATMLEDLDKLNQEDASSNFSRDTTNKMTKILFNTKKTKKLDLSAFTSFLLPISNPGGLGDGRDDDDNDDDDEGGNDEDSDNDDDYMMTTAPDASAFDCLFTR